MLNKELLMAGSEQSQRKVVLTIGKFDIFFGHAYGYMKDFVDDTLLSVVPYWGTTANALERLAYFDTPKKSMFMLNEGPEVTVFVEGYSTSLPNGGAVEGDPYEMCNSEGSTRYLTFDPPPDGYLDPKTHNPI